MTGLEETFRTVLAARLPDDAKWAAWIDGTVAELAACAPPQGIDRDTLAVILSDEDLGPSLADRRRIADRILALVRPVEGITLTPEEAARVLRWASSYEDQDPFWGTADDALVALLEGVR